MTETRRVKREGAVEPATDHVDTGPMGNRRPKKRQLTVSFPSFRNASSSGGIRDSSDQAALPNPRSQRVSAKPSARKGRDWSSVHNPLPAEPCTPAHCHGKSAVGNDVPRVKGYVAISRRPVWKLQGTLGWKRSISCTVYSSNLVTSSRIPQHSKTWPVQLPSSIVHARASKPSRPSRQPASWQGQHCPTTSVPFPPSAWGLDADGEGL